MKIAVVCANGKAGKLIVGEALNRNMEVTAVVRNENKTAAPQAIVKDLFELSAEDLSGFDAVVDAFGTWTPETLPQHSTSLSIYAIFFPEPKPVFLLLVAQAASM